jgi:hypothetical protein
VTPELQQWYEEQFNLFNTQGWKDLVEQMKEMQKNYENLRNLPSDDTLKFRQGQLDILDWITGWQTSVEQNFKELQNEDAV